MSEEKYFEDFALGDRFRVASKTLTDAHFLLFSALTGDTHPIHYDVEYAKKTRFGRPVAHGYLVTILTAMGASTLNWAVEHSIVAFVEQSSRMLKPVFVGDTLTPEGEVVELIPGRSQGRVRFRTWVTNQHGEVVLEGSQTYLVKRRVPLAE
ncbi:MAG: MaoC family dehydratase [Dehalococcoidia bacterium]|nr:MAG: MaoC family dehydratase [Dehalococcoidia bacterium]